MIAGPGIRLILLVVNRSKHTRDYRECFLIGQNRTKHAHFSGSPLFQATYNIKTDKQTINSLSLCQLDAGRLAEGKVNETDSDTS